MERERDSEIEGKKKGVVMGREAPAGHQDLYLSAGFGGT